MGRYLSIDKFVKTYYFIILLFAKFSFVQMVYFFVVVFLT